MDAVEIRPYEARHHAAVLQALIDLQNYEVPLHDTRLPGEPTTAPYFEDLLREVRRRRARCSSRRTRMRSPAS